MGKKIAVEKVSLVDLARVYILAVIEGALCLVSLCFAHLWKRNSLQDAHFREKPPDCLTDSALGNHLYIKVKGVKLHYVESGSKESPPLILLHGFPDSWISWRYQIPFLAKHYRVIAVDLKGMGESDKPQSASAYSVERLINELHSLVNALTAPTRGNEFNDDCRRVVIVAHGIGAVIAWHYLSTPVAIEKVSKFVAIAAPHPNIYWTQSLSNSIFNSRWVGLCQIPLLPEFKCLNNDMAFINTCHNYLSPSNRQDALILDAYKYLFSRFEDWRGAVNYFRTLPLTRIKVSKKMSIIMPTLLIAGSEDPCVPLTAMVASTDFLENHRVKVVPASSNFPHQEAPDIVNSLLIDFLIGTSDSCKGNYIGDGSNSLVQRIYGAVSSTVNSIQKRTTDIRTRALSLKAPTG